MKKRAHVLNKKLRRFSFFAKNAKYYLRNLLETQSHLETGGLAPIPYVTIKKRTRREREIFENGGVITP